MKRRAALALVAALIAGAALAGFATSLSMSSARIDTFSAALSASTTVGDVTPPAVTAREFLDTDADGKIDQVKVTYNELLGAYTGTAGDWTANNVPAGMSVNPATVTISGSQVLLGWTTLSTNPATAATTMTLSLTSAAAVRDAAGNAAATFSNLAVADKAAPVAIRAEYYDASSPANGIIDQIKVTYSEALASTTATSPWSIQNGPSGMVTADLNGASTSGAVVSLSFSEGSGGGATVVTTVAPSLTLSLANPALTPEVRDTVAPSNAASSFSAMGTADKARPIAIFAELPNGGTVDDRADKGDRIIVRFSEALDRQTICASTSPDWTASPGVLNADNQVTVTISNTNPDSVSVSSTSCGAGGLQFGTIDLADDGHVGATRTFGGLGTNKSTLTWTPASAEISILLGLASGTTSTVNAQRTAVYTPNPGLADSSGNLVAGDIDFKDKQF